MIKDSKTYDLLKFIGNIILPAFATLYLTLAKLWGLPFGEAIAGTSTAFAVFINAILKKESDDYWKEMGF